MSYVGSSIGSIRVEARLGSGGMGEVYLGYDPRLDRRVAVKTIRPENRLSPQVKARFLREARLLSKLGHPAICQVYDLVETPEADFLILEYVQGTTLRRLAEREELPLERKLRLAEKIAVALAAAHREQIVHRDLKADNIMVTPEGEVKVLDFGIARSLSDPGVVLTLAPALPGLPDPSEDGDATHELGPAALREWATEPGARDTDRLTRLGMVVGTIPAMSPEQVTGGEVTQASDLYSFGVLLQELCTGLPAYEAVAEEELLRQVSRARTRPIAGLDPDVVRLIEDLESLDPRRRPTADAAAERLRGLLDKPQRQRRQRLRFAAVAAAFVFLVAVLAVVSWLAVRAERSRREAEHRRKQAESLIGFMLGDLRQRLEQVNRLDILDAVGDRALAYFDGVPEGQLNDAELAHRVQAIDQIGEVRYAQGNLPAALTAFRRSRALAADLVTRNPSSPNRQHVLWELIAWVGQVHFDQRALDQALVEWTEDLRLAREQLRFHPRGRRWLEAVALSHHNLGSLLDLRGDLPGALRSYRESLALQRELAAGDPRNDDTQAEIAATLAFVSNDLERQGDLAAALAERRAHLAIHERLAARQPADPSRKQDLATARGFVATLLVPLGRWDEARELYQQGLADLATLSREDPENTILRRWLAALQSGLGALAVAEGRPAEALGPLAQARQILEPLVAKDPTSSDWRLQLGICRSRTAAALETLDPARARSEARAALAILAPLLAQPDEPTRGLIAEAEVLHGRTAAALGAPDEARTAWERALTLLAPCPRPLTHWKVLSPLAQALLALDRVPEARPAVERLWKMGYRNAGLAKLCRETGLPAS
jgi:tetratricopeptide (TPR) repeat protein/predicted Ser/Thr protein kinase